MGLIRQAEVTASLKTYLDLDIEHRLSVHLEAKRALDVMRKTLLVALLDRGPLLLEARVVNVLQDALRKTACVMRAAMCQVVTKVLPPAYTGP